jgi:hypothetical protein
MGFKSFVAKVGSSIKSAAVKFLAAAREATPEVKKSDILTTPPHGVQCRRLNRAQRRALGYYDPNPFRYAPIIEEEKPVVIAVPAIHKCPVCGNHSFKPFCSAEHARFYSAALSVLRKFKSGQKFLLNTNTRLIDFFVDLVPEGVYGWRSVTEFTDVLKSKYPSIVIPEVI